MPGRSLGSETAVERSRLLERARELPWYHALELAPGFVTRGEFDLRPYVDRHGLPERMDGIRAVDIGTFDGFWAFEMERRGAEVVALDLDHTRELDWPAFRPRVVPDAPIGDAFRIARELLGSRVERVGTSIYDARPESLGTFDFAFCGAMVIHLRDQFGALERIHALLRDGGKLVSAEPYDRLIGLLPFPAARYRAHRPKAPVFWEPSPRVWQMMLEASGFTDIRKVAKFRMNSLIGYHIHVVVHHALRLGPPPRDSD